MATQAIRGLVFRVIVGGWLLVVAVMSAPAEAQITWKIVGTAPGEPDLVGTVTTPDIPVNCVNVVPTTCPIYGTLIIPAGTSVGGPGGPFTFDLAADPDSVLISIATSPLSSGDSFFLFDLNRYGLLCDSPSSLEFECTEPFSGNTVSYDLEITEQQPSVAIGDGNIVVTGQIIVPAEPPTVYSIGDTGPAGGIVFYVTDGGVHGLEAAPYDQGRAEWGCDGNEIAGADGIAVGTGAQNTLDVLVDCVELLALFHAARIADNYSLNGHDDWFLPSQDELDLMYENLHNQAVPLGGFGPSFYWSSSEFDLNLAYDRSFGAGNQGDGNKDDANRVRAVRAF